MKLWFTPGWVNHRRHHRRVSYNWALKIGFGHAEKRNISEVDRSVSRGT